jgi:branched-chain amino acid transport system substrate-binding protein
MRRWTHTLTLGALLALVITASAFAATSTKDTKDASSILFAMATPLSGPLTFNGTQELDGATLAVAQLNAKGGVLGHKINLVSEDDACNPTEAVTAGNKLIDEHPLVLFGFHCSSATLAGMPLVERAQIPLINSVSTNPNIVAGSGVGGNKWVFTLTPSDATFATALARFYRLQKVHSIAIVAENTDYGRGGAEAMGVRARSFGITVTSTNYYTQGTSDFTSVLASIKSQNPDRVAYWGLGADDANFSRQFAQTFQGSKTLFSGRPELTGPDTPTVQTGALNGATTAEQYTYTINTPANRKFVAQFQKAYGSVPITQSFEGYQEVMLAAAAVQKAHKLTPLAVRNALATIKFQSMLAPPKKNTLHFDRYQQAHDRAVIAIVRGSKVVLQALLPT